MLKKIKLKKKKKKLKTHNKGTTTGYQSGFQERI